MSAPPVPTRSRRRSGSPSGPPPATEQPRSTAAKTLTLPPPLPPEALRVVALGGISEIGRNMTVFEYGAGGPRDSASALPGGASPGGDALGAGPRDSASALPGGASPGGDALGTGKSRLLVVDCGMLLGKTNAPGVDLALPDWSFFRDRLDDIDAIVLTHGHEDHIGALPYLLRERADIPLIGSRLTLALISAKLEQHRIRPVLQTVRETDKLTVGGWELEFFAVNHSIPDALAVAIKAGPHTLLHTGDFKMDQTPLDGRLTDLPGFSRLGAQGVDMLLADSTNAEVPGFIPSERDVGRVVDDVILKAQGRVIVACFASHVHRVQQVLDAAVDSGRQVALVGRSMVRNMQIARDLGLLKVPDGLLMELRDLDQLPSAHTLLVCTGSQGEPLSALSRMANREHQTIRVVPDDTILLASSLIPGNENAVFRIINGLSRLGATVVHKSTALVHVSGHAPAGELRYLLNAVKPKNLMPVHGEWRHLRAHAAIGHSMGLSPEQTVLAENGTVVDLVKGRASIVGIIPVGHVFVDGLAVGDIGELAIKDRQILGEEGFISMLVAVDFQVGKVVFGPEITARGFTEDPHALDPILAELVDAVEKAVADGAQDAEAIEHTLRRTVGRWVDQKYRRRPMLLPLVISV